MQKGTLIRSCQDDPDQRKAEEFLCSLYGMKGAVKEINEARYAKLCQMTGKINKVTLIFFFFFFLPDYQPSFIMNEILCHLLKLG